MLYASVAQLVEQGTENPRVVGSIPTGGTTNADLAHLVERDLAKVEVAGSIPVIRSKKDGHEKDACPLFMLIGGSQDLLLIIAEALLQKQSPSSEWRHSQVVRQRSAKPLSPGSNPGVASKTKSTS